MYRLTPRMQQNLRQNLIRYHELFSGGRCSGWELEELIFKAIQSDNAAQHHAFWREAGHDDEADIRVRTNGIVHNLQIKSGRIAKRSGALTLSGHRLGRFKGDLAAISEYLNDSPGQLLSVPYEKIDDDEGRKHIYQILYVDSRDMGSLSGEGWERKGASWIQSNRFGVQFSLRPSMSWQIWWIIPERHLDKSQQFVIT